jgi:hypothetical protein
VVNALTGANYGFRSYAPEQASMLDLFSKEPWLYPAPAPDPQAEVPDARGVVGKANRAATQKLRGS